MLAVLTYTSSASLERRFGRRPATQASAWPAFGPRLDVETYLHHQADKLVRRFDANTYLYLSSAMDRYDPTVAYGSDEAAFDRIRADVVAIGISSDWLYPAEQVRALVEGIRGVGGRAEYAEIISDNGHDAFLNEWDQMDAALRPALHRGSV
jgi:homoserine O-acetyltransferase